MSRPTDMRGVRTSDPNEVIARLIQLGEDYADQDAAASILEETKKTRLAALTLEVTGRAGADGRRVSRVDAETVALASPEFRDHLTSMVEARKQANRTKVRYFAGQAWVDLVRTLEATKRAEIGLGGRQT